MKDNSGYPQPLIVKQLQDLEHSFKLLYFLRDLGIKSAGAAAREHWMIYAHILSAIESGG